jgi:hypothetical protein
MRTSCSTSFPKIQPLPTSTATHGPSPNATTMHFTLPLVLSLIPAATAHFHLYYPWWRGDSLALAKNNQSISQWFWPCKPLHPSYTPYMFLILTEAPASAKKPAPPTAPSGPSPAAPSCGTRRTSPR